VEKILVNYLKWIRIYDDNRDSYEIEKLINKELKTEKFSKYEFKKKCKSIVNLDSDQDKGKFYSKMIILIFFKYFKIKLKT